MKCNQCDGKLTIRMNRNNGSFFLGCTNYFQTQCNYAVNIPDATIGYLLSVKLASNDRLIDLIYDLLEDPGQM